jgi:NADH-quinone oxidoreductase subunit A
LLETYLPVLIFIAIGIAFGCAPILLSYFVVPKKPDAVKCAPYECGFAPFEDARVPFQVKYYLIAILFILFDLETAFFFPWAVSLKDIGWFGFGSMMIFLSILVIGFIYEWKAGALEWE